MNITIVNPYAQRPGEPGTIRHFAFGRALVDRGHDVTIVAAAFDHVRRTQRFAGQTAIVNEMVDGVRYAWIPVPAYGGMPARVRSMLSFARALKNRRNGSLFAESDVVLASSPHLHAAAAAADISAELDRPFVAEIRDLWPDSFIELLGTSPWHPYVLWNRRLERRVYRAAEHLITLLPRAVDHFVRFGISPDRVTWVPNAVDLSMLPARHRRKCPPTDRKRVVYAGALGPPNAIDILVAAARKVCAVNDEVEFLFVGEGPVRQAIEAGLTAAERERIRFVGAVPRSEVYDWLRDGDLLWASTRDSRLYRFGTSPQKIGDYLAAGRPIVFGSTDPEDVVARARAGLVVPAENVNALAVAVLDLLNRPPAELRRMGDAGKAYVRKELSVQVLADRYEKILKQVVERHGSRAGILVS